MSTIDESKQTPTPVSYAEALEAIKDIKRDFLMRRMHWPESRYVYFNRSGYPNNDGKLILRLDDGSYVDWTPEDGDAEASDWYTEA